MDVKQLHRQGASVREIARRTGFSRATVRKILATPTPKPYGPRPPRPPKLGPFLDRLEALRTARPLSPATVLYETIRAEGYSGHYEAVKRWARSRRREEAARRRACVRFETGPGEEGQFDWKGPVRGLLADRPELEVHFFRFVLAWSRFAVTRVVTSLALPATLAALCRVFGQLGGVPRRLVLDNPKTAVLRPKPHLELHPAFAELCRHYGCEPDPAWPYHPERKGKTERSFRDLIDSGLLEARYESLAALQRAVDALEAARMARLHTTTGEAPAERAIREREELIPLPGVAFDPRIPEIRRVLSDCTVSYRAARYSVPYRLVGSRVTLKADPLGEALEIFDGADLVAIHRSVASGQRSIVEEHIAELRRPRFERLRQRPRRPESPHRTLPVEPLSVVPWPRIEVPLRPIEHYLEALGGAR